MRAEISVVTPCSDVEWSDLVTQLGPSSRTGRQLVEALVGRLREAGAVSVLQECSYIDRDFSASYSAFYSTLFQPFRKYCRRAHFFSVNLASAMATPSPRDRVVAFEALKDRYLGNFVVRPVEHAPISSAYLSAAALAPGRFQDSHAISRFKFHVMGVEFEVDAAPLTQQDTRTGACAQAAVWMAGRHFHNRRGAPWFSVVDITKIALKPIDSGITRSLPAGSEWLTNDNIVRALRSMGRHPVTYGAPAGRAISPPEEVIARYVDSGIPVLLGLKSPNAPIGHAVLVVGTERSPSPRAPTQAATTARFLTHFLVNDDQRGPYCRLPIHANRSGDYPFRLKRDLVAMFVPLPDKVFIKAEVAELRSFRSLRGLASRRYQLASSKNLLGPHTKWDVEPDFYKQVEAGAIVMRTYLTFGWRYKQRALRNTLAEELQAEILETQFPRFVWVTEFYKQEGARARDPAVWEVMGHAVVDATTSSFSDAPLVLDAPGISIIWRYDPAGKEPLSRRRVIAKESWGPSRPKVRGAV
jgi:hypothetical protein